MCSVDFVKKRKGFTFSQETLRFRSRGFLFQRQVLKNLNFGGGFWVLVSGVGLGFGFWVLVFRKGFGYWCQTLCSVDEVWVEQD